jgi:uncharacterized protein YcaQ
MVHELSRRDARRIAVSAQLLAAPRPTDPLDVVRHLSLVQMDLTAAVAPSADLVLWSRLGPAYRPADLDALLDAGAVVEYQGVLRPAEDMALYRADMEDWPGRPPLREWKLDVRDWVEANHACREDILQRLRSEGPLPARELPDTCAIPWRSSGWNDNRNVDRLLATMERRGEVAVSAREGRERLWDLADRVYPDDPAVPAEEAAGIRNERRLASLGIARAKGPECPVEPLDVGDAGEPAVIEGVRGAWRVDPTRLGQPFRGRTALVSPLDRLVVDRKRIAEVFEFDYQLEMYKPASARRWGYWAMPILHGDRLVGKLDASADHEAGVLRVAAVHLDVELSQAARAAVDREVRALGSWLGLEVVSLSGNGSPRGRSVRRRRVR